MKTQLTLREKIALTSPLYSGVKEAVGWTDEEHAWGRLLTLNTRDHLRIYMQLKEGRPCTPEEARRYLEFEKWLNEVHRPRKYVEGGVAFEYLRKFDAYLEANPHLKIETP